MQLAGHGKDPRLVQVELPIVPSVGDRIREDANSPDWAHKLPHLIREGEFIESGKYFSATFWKVRMNNGKFAKFNPDNCEIIKRAIAPVLVESDRYQFLLERREQLIASGASPQGVWINCGKVPRRDFRQAVWKSDKPRPEWGDKKSQYIGKFMGEEHLSAIAQHRAGQELRKIEREIKKLQVKS